MIYRINHRTEYLYNEPVSLCQNLARLTPRNTLWQTCELSKLQIEPTPAGVTPWTDYFGNQATSFAVQEPHRQLVVTAAHLVAVNPFVPPGPLSSPAWEAVRDQLPGDRSPHGLEAYQFVFDSPFVQASPWAADYAAGSFTPGRPLLDAVLDLTHRIHTDFRYDPTATTMATPLEEVFSKRRGVCQDFAHLQIACLRSLGLGSRYVSGYLRTNTPPGRPRLIGADASHAWLSVWCPGVGWVDVDPTNDQIPTTRHIVLAWGRDYDDVSPIKGVILGGGQHHVVVGVDVTAMGEEE
jgi:transglutaminase-like putative cysteine protease